MKYYTLKPTPPAAIAKSQDTKPAFTGKKKPAQTAPVLKQALTRKDIRQEYSVSEKTIARWEKRGLRASKLMRTRLYLRRDIEAFIESSF